MRKPFFPLLFCLVFLSISALPAPAFSAAPPVTLQENGRNIPTLAPLVQKVAPAVVNIAVRGKMAVEENPMLSDPFFRHFFGLPQQPQEQEFQAAGSGVIVNAAKGYVLTNNHVVKNAQEITVTLNDGRNFKAKLLGTDPPTDIALLQIPAHDLTALPLGNSDHLRVGDFVVAIGNPFGLGQTVTSGIVSALGRTGLGIEGYEDFIQTDASINPGNSGGALIDLRGHLVGINTAILAPSGGNVGIGFAIPINMARSIMDQLIEYGKVRRGELGVEIQNLTPKIAQALGTSALHGAVVTQVLKGTSAEKAGLKSGDVIVALNGVPVRGAEDLRNKVGLLRVGQSIRLEIIRNGKKETITASIGPQREINTQAGTQEISPKLRGAQFGPLQENSPLYGKVTGVEVLKVAPNSPAWDAGLRQGDVVTQANRHRVRNLEEFRRAVKEEQGGLLLLVRRGDGALYIEIQ